MFRLLSLCPRLKKREDRLVGTTAWRMRVLLLGTVLREVTVAPSQHRVIIDSRYLWLIRRKRAIDFSDVTAVTYGYEDMSAGDLLAFGHDSYDWFTVGLRLRNDNELRLFNFIGDGTFSNNGPLPDWMYWDDFVLDISGTQEQESKLFAEFLSKAIDVAIVPPRD